MTEVACTHEGGHLATYDEVKRLLGRETEDFPAQEVTDRNFLAILTLSLSSHFSARISRIDVDQWWGVGVQTYEMDEDGKPVFRSYVECDSPLDGLAACWMNFYEKYGLKFEDEAEEVGQSA